jgi:hypothetical protein
MCENNVQPVLSDSAQLISALSADGKWILGEKLFYYIFRLQPAFQPPPSVDPEDLARLSPSEHNIACMLNSAIQQTYYRITGMVDLPPASAAQASGNGVSSCDSGLPHVDVCGPCPRQLSPNLEHKGGVHSGSMQSTNPQSSNSLIPFSSLHSALDMPASLPRAHPWAPAQAAGLRQLRHSDSASTNDGGPSRGAKGGAVGGSTLSLPSVSDLASSLMGMTVASEGPPSDSVNPESFDSLPMPPSVPERTLQPSVASRELLCCHELITVYVRVGKDDRAAALLHRMLQCASTLFAFSFQCSSQTQLPHLGRQGHEALVLKGMGQSFHQYHVEPTCDPAEPHACEMACRWHTGDVLEPTLPAF